MIGTWFSFLRTLSAGDARELLLAKILLVKHALEAARRGAACLPDPFFSYSRRAAVCPTVVSR
jgi:hypothetical protein